MHPDRAAGSRRGRRADPRPGRADGRRRSRRCRSPTAPSPGRSASTPTSGTTSRRRWRCSSAARSRPPTGPSTGACDTQRDDGSWPMKIVAGEVEDHSGETNMSAYLAVGVWHHWLVRRDVDFVRRHWPAVRRALDWVVVDAAAVRRHRLVAGVGRRPPGDGQRGGAARRLVEHLPVAARRGGALGADGRAAAGVGARRRPARPRAARAPRPVPRQVARSRWTGTTRCSAARSAATAADGCSRAAGTTSSCPGSASAASTPTRG